MADSEGSKEISYEASCHCGAIKYSVKLPPLETTEIINCNCSICSTNGYLNVYPNCDKIEYHAGEELMKGYKFGREKFTHLFCPTCASSLFVDPGEVHPGMRVVNVCI